MIKFKVKVIYTDTLEKWKNAITKMWIKYNQHMMEEYQRILQEGSATKTHTEVYGTDYHALVNGADNRTA